MPSFSLPEVSTQNRMVIIYSLLCLLFVLIIPIDFSRPKVYNNTTGVEVVLEDDQSSSETPIKRTEEPKPVIVEEKPEIKTKAECDCTRRSKRLDWVIPGDVTELELQIKEPNGRIITSQSVNISTIARYVEIKPGQRVTVIAK